MSPAVRVCGDVAIAELATLLARYGLTLVSVVSGENIPGSFWRDSEAGLIGATVYAHSDTPLHSVLHETCHYVCMDSIRRRVLHTNAGGDHAEENAVCYLQILLAEHLPALGRERMLADMDAWGYSFRLGSAQRWFEEDAADARDWLHCEQLIDAENNVTWRVRGAN